LLSYLDILVYEQIHVFVGRQFHGHLMDSIPRRSPNDVFVSTVLETIVLILLRGR